MTSTDIPATGQLVIVRNRPARVTDVQAFSGNTSTTHKVDLQYCDGWFHPENESIIWELEPQRKVQSRLSLPQIDDPSSRPDNPDLFDVYIRSLRWSNHSTWLSETTPELLSPWFAAVQVEDYQLYPVLKSIMMPRVSLLLADDVGLGKTIQAGLILAELIRRRKIRKVLILCPAGLQTQWQEEMNEKFHIDFTMIDRMETTRIQRELGMDTNPWKAKQRIITSIDYLRQPDILDQFLAYAESSMDKDNPSMPWDLIIVDEAHNMAPAGFGQLSQRHQMLEQISKYFEHRLFLTATPHNGYTMSFTTLLTLLDPVRFSPKVELDEDDRIAVKKTMVRRLKSELNEGTDPPRFPLRHIEGVKVDFSKKEIDLFDALSEYRNSALKMLEGHTRRDINLGRFLFSLLTKRLLSSTYAFARTWYQHIEGIVLDEEVRIELAEQVKKRAEQDLADDVERSNREDDAIRYGTAWLRLFGNSERLQPLRDSINQALERLGWSSDVLMTAIDDQTSLPDDGRWNTLLNWVKEKLMIHGGFRDDERVILFTEYLDTLKYLKRRFILEGIDEPILQTLYGGAKQEVRDIIKREFNSEDSPLRIILATDTASEGLNFQYYCRFVFHQDIPWNPMRMEQRNGRVDRHNQSRDVFVHHYWTDQQADLEFLSRIIKKVDQVREDLGSVGQVFNEAFELQFSGKDVSITDDKIDDRISDIKANSQETGDLSNRDSGTVNTYQTAINAFHRTQEDLDINPQTLALLFSKGVKMAGGEVVEETPGIYRMMNLPASLKQLVNESLLISRGSLQGSLPKVTFDTTVFEKEINGRKIFRSKPDTVLLRLNHPLMKWLLGSFEKYMWGEDSGDISRWTIDKGDSGNKLIEIKCLLQATNSLRESLYTNIITMYYNPETQTFEELTEYNYNFTALSSQEISENREMIMDLWVDHNNRIVSLIKEEKKNRENRLTEKADASLQLALEMEKEGFKKRKEYLRSQKGQRALNKLRAEIENQERKLQQRSLFVEEDEAQERILQEQRWQLAEHEKRIDLILEYVNREEKRMLNYILPNRYKIANVDLQPVGVKIILGVNHE